MERSEGKRPDGGEVIGKRMIANEVYSVVKIPPVPPEDVRTKDKVPEEGKAPPERAPKDQMTRSYDGMGTMRKEPKGNPHGIGGPNFFSKTYSI